MKGAAVLLLKFKSGCVVPWHWHTANENLMMVSGKAKGEMRPGGAHVLTAGDYLYMAGKQVHQFTCISSCLVFDVIDGAFDIHYVNADGKEMTPEEALKRWPSPPPRSPKAAFGCSGYSCRSQRRRPGWQPARPAHRAA